jgi:hypothetical protein
MSVDTGEFDDLAARTYHVDVRDLIAVALQRDLGRACGMGKGMHRATGRMECLEGLRWRR